MHRLPVLLLLAGASALLQAEDWPQFRGPTGQGHAAERGLPLEWSETRNIIWKTPVPGLGWSSPAVANGRVWLTTVVESKERRGRVSASLRALAFDAATGREVVNVENIRSVTDVGAEFEVARAVRVAQPHADPIKEVEPTTEANVEARVAAQRPLAA